MKMGQQIRARREQLGLSQEQLAEAVGVSFQAVSGWERDQSLPDTARLPQLADVLKTSTDFLLGTIPALTASLAADRLFDEERMYTFVKAAATAQGLQQTLRALPFAREQHQGQLRKGQARIPYISHPLTMCCHALAMGLQEDGLLAAILLHDVVEDCGVRLDALPVDEDTRETVRLLSKDPRHEEDEEGYDLAYFGAMAGHPQALLIKLLDRCHNLSVMSAGFSRQRMLTYVQHTQQHVMPLADTLRGFAPEYSNACFLLKYQMQSLMHTVLQLLVGG